MATTVATPETDERCACCGSRIFDHAPSVRDCVADCGSARHFCSHACLSASIDENELT